jgi:hypothetical protein
MSGRRRTHGRRGDDGRVRPTVSVERAARIHSSARLRYAAAQTARERLAVAMDYARAAAAAASRAGVDVDAAVEDGTRSLFAIGDKLTKALAKSGGAR